MLGAFFPTSAASRVAAAHRANPSATAPELSAMLGIKLHTVHSVASQRGLRLRVHRAPAPAPVFKKVGYAGQEQGW